MVFMTMRDNNAAKLVLVLEHVRVIRKHQIDTGLGVIRKHKASIDQHHIGTALDNGHVLANAIKATEGDDLQRRGFTFSCCHKRNAILSDSRTDICTANNRRINSYGYYLYPNTGF